MFCLTTKSPAFTWLPGLFVDKVTCVYLITWSVCWQSHLRLLDYLVCLSTKSPAFTWLPGLFVDCLTCFFASMHFSMIRLCVATKLILLFQHKDLTELKHLKVSYLQTVVYLLSCHYSLTNSIRTLSHTWNMTNDEIIKWISHAHSTILTFNEWCVHFNRCYRNSWDSSIN